MRFVDASAQGALEETAAVLNAGGVAVIPTDTVYGLAARPDFPAAVERLYAIKHRDARKPIAMLASGPGAVRAAGAELCGEAERLAERHWPGALTLVLRCGDACEGFRVPANTFARRLAALCGGLLRATSANLSGCAAAADAPAALEAVGLSCDIAVDGGPAVFGAASTVVRFAGPFSPPEILRPGPVRIETGLAGAAGGK